MNFIEQFPGEYDGPEPIIRIVDGAEIAVKPTIEELAKIIIHLDDSDQALLFSKMGEFANFSVERQLAAVTINEQLTEEGRRMMEAIGEYAEP